jgi:hypothetical protein
MRDHKNTVAPHLSPLRRNNSAPSEQRYSVPSVFDRREAGGPADRGDGIPGTLNVSSRESLDSSAL